MVVNWFSLPKRKKKWADSKCRIQPKLVKYMKHVPSYHIIIQQYFNSCSLFVQRVGTWVGFGSKYNKVVLQIELSRAENDTGSC